MCIPRPIWRTVKGKVIGALPENWVNICVMFTRDLGMIDDLGCGGPRIQADGTFETYAQPGCHRLAVWEMTPTPQPGHTRMTRELAFGEVKVRTRDVDGFEIQLSPLPVAVEPDSRRAFALAYYF